MTLIRICAFATCAMMALCIGFAQEMRTSGPQVSPQEAAELANWARAQSQSGNVAGVSAQDAQELAEWARAHARPASVPPSDVRFQQPRRTESVEFAAWNRERTNDVGPFRRRFQSRSNAVENSAASPTPADPSEVFHGRTDLAFRVNAEEPQDQLPNPGDPDASGDEELIDDDLQLFDDGSPKVWNSAWGLCHTCFDSGIVFGAETLFLVPLTEPNQYVTLTDLTNGDQLTGTADPGIGLGFRTWLGIETHHGWGIRFRYTTLGNGTVDPNSAVPIKANPAFNESFYFNAYTADVELTQRMYLHHWKIESSFGGRYASLERNHTVVGYGDMGNVSLFGLAMGANEIQGAGFTFSMTAYRPIHWFGGGKKGKHGHGFKGKGCAVGGWSTYAGFRGSLLWADATASVLTEANAVTKQPIGSAQANSRNKAYTTKDHTEDVWIAEAILGVQYEHCLHHCFPWFQRFHHLHRGYPPKLFFRAGMEYQYWNTGNLAAQSNSFAFLQGAPPAFGGRVDAVANAHNGDLNLIGWVIGAGITY